MGLQVPCVPSINIYRIHNYPEGTVEVVVVNQSFNEMNKIQMELVLFVNEAFEWKEINRI